MPSAEREGARERTRNRDAVRVHAPSVPPGDGARVRRQRHEVLLQRGCRGAAHPGQGPRPAAVRPAAAAAAAAHAGCAAALRPEALQAGAVPEGDTGVRAGARDAAQPAARARAAVRHGARALAPGRRHRDRNTKRCAHQPPARTPAAIAEAIAAAGRRGRGRAEEAQQAAVQLPACAARRPGRSWKGARAHPVACGVGAPGS
eukprot:scaffold1334_cov344-Prasinococcus_capsulatus_cf.AAC.11